MKYIAAILSFWLSAWVFGISGYMAVKDNMAWVAFFGGGILTFVMGVGCMMSKAQEEEVQQQREEEELPEI